MPVPVPETLEDAKALLLENSETINQLNQQIETLNGQITEKDTTINDLRTLNQKYFLRLAQGEQEPETNPEPAETLEEYAKTLKGVFIK